MNLAARPHRRSRGFLLLEVILALAVFMIAGVSFVVIFGQMRKSASLIQSELRITRILDSALDETLSLPVLEEGNLESYADDDRIVLTTTIEILDEMEAEDGQILQDMYHITVTARFSETDGHNPSTPETWRYGRIYQPS